MKKIISGWLIAILVLVVFVGLVTPAVSDGGDSSETDSRTREWSNYQVYYNKTFNIDKAWEADNVSIVVFVQTDDQTTKSKDPGGSAGTFLSAEVMQSVMDFLDGKQTSTGTNRRVLGELFTASWCGYCPGADGAFDRILRDPSYFPSKVTLIEAHPSGDHGNTDGAARLNWYDFGGGIPTSIFDGVDCLTGGNANANVTTIDTWYKGVINARQPTASIVDITTFGRKTSSDGWINASITLLGPTDLRNLKVNFWLIEDLYPTDASGAYLRYTLQKDLGSYDFIPPNHAPNIKDSISPVSIPEDSPGSMSIRLADHFEDDDLDELTFYSNRDGENKGNITVAIDDVGNVTLTPDADWNGEEEIAFYSNDGIEDSPSTKVTVTVNAVNDAPIVANPIVDFSMNEDFPVDDKINLSHVFYDIDTDTTLNAIPQAPLTFSYSGSENIQVTIKSDGWVILDPDTDWNGNETLTFKATDSASEYASDNVKIWVKSDNDPPTLTTALVPLTIDEDENKKDFIDLNDYFSDTDGDTLNYAFDESQNFTIKLKGSLVTLNPEPNWWGTDTLTFYAHDIPGSDPVPATLDVTVNSVNDAPILYSLDKWTIKTSGLKTTEYTIEINQDQEVEMTVSADDLADNDALIFADDTELFDIDSTTGEIKFTPTNSDVGIHTVNISVDDQQSKNNLAYSEFFFRILNVNDPPDTPLIKSPEDQKTYITDTEIEFEASADDPDLAIEGSKERLSYEWTTNKSSDVLSVDDKFETHLTPGVYEITVTVSDRSKDSSSASVVITVDIDREKDMDSDGTPDYMDDDIDGDGMPNSWEKLYSLNPEDPTDANKDADKDTYSNLDEYLGTDGKPGGDDSSNPKVGSSTPKVESDSGDSSSTSLDSTIIIAAIAVVVIIAILVVLFMMMKKKKKVSEPEPKPEPTPEQVQVQPQMQIPPTMQDLYGEPPQQQMMPPQQQTTPQQSMTQQPQPMGGDMYAMQQQPQGGMYSQQPAPMYPYPQQQPQPQQQMPAPPTQELPSTVDTPLLPSGEAPSEPEVAPEQGQEITQEPSQPEGSAEEPTEEPTSEATDESAPASNSCPNCNEPIKEGWMMCPNCKETI
jgi:hypothetical protein